MQCWSVCDDIKDLREMRAIRTLSKDELDDYLLGLQSIYQLKFEKLSIIFENYCKNKQ